MWGGFYRSLKYIGNIKRSFSGIFFLVNIPLSILMTGDEERFERVFFFFFFPGCKNRGWGENRKLVVLFVCPNFVRIAFYGWFLRNYGKLIQRLIPMKESILRFGKIKKPHFGSWRDHQLLLTFYFYYFFFYK
jgi:hypothetical protein